MKRTKRKSLMEILEEFRLDILEEIALQKIKNDINKTPKEEIVFIYYKIKNGVKHFSDWEPVFHEFEESDGFNEIDEAKEKQIIPGTSNMIYSDEKYDQTSLKDLLFVISCLCYPEKSVDVLIITINLWCKGITPYKLSQLMGISKQSVSEFLTGKRPLPDLRKKQIAEILEFDFMEYEWEKTDYVFDETDI